ncbi:SIS domain-containing protein [Paenibacillus sp. BSR1-1]|uniref:SIS domain-containing protein n=1 Tax=Paenibacillus sp. BSR1-1 TaxID=3020845 RepID=UPI0025AF91DF|nr:SIS domain-containing protein [Paenibacillus sp. BSR1-1]MDN3018066.1 SIS domain-containing protein [Paenibacillus sp. BSR1-1]
MLNFNREKYLTVTCGAVGLREEIERVADQVYEKGFKNIFLIGSGGAVATFYPFEYMINSTSTIPAYAEIAAEFVLQNHKQFTSDSLVILSSLSGTTEETVAAAKYCKERGATTIGLTGEYNKPLADTVDFPLVNFAENDFASDSNQLVLYLLIFKLMNKNGDFPNYETFAAQLEVLPEKLIEVKEQFEARAEAFAVAYKDEPYHMVVGSGSTWGRAYSYAMCVLEEMQWIKTKSIHAAEFFHGTLELVDENTSMILLTGEDETRPLMERVERFSEKYTKKVTILDTKDYELEGISEEFRKYLSPIVTSTQLQRLSVHLEDKRNHSLEIRRYYRTVTY